MSSCSHSPLAPTATACLAISGASAAGLNTSTRSIFSGTSASERYTRSPNSVSAYGLIGMMRKPRFCRPAGTEPPAFLESRDAPTTAITLAASRISRPDLLITNSSSAAGRCIPCLDSKQWLPRGVAADLLAREPIAARLPARHRARDVWSDKGVRHVPEGMVGRQRLGVGHVERGPNAA